MKRWNAVLFALLVAAGVAFIGCEKKEEPKEPAKEEAKAEEAKGTETKAEKEAESAEAKAPSGEPVRIGAIFAVTGPASSLGLPERQTVDMLVEEINAKGGVLGRPLEVVIYDTEGDETKAVTFVKRLVSNDNVVAVIGPTRSGPSMAILDTINSAKIPLVSCAASYKIVTDEEGKAREWIYKTPQSDSMAVEKIYDYFNGEGITKIAIMTVSNGYGDSGRAELKRLAKNYGIEILADERFSQDDTDMTPQLTKINGTEAEAIVVWAVQKAPAIVAKNHKTLGMKQLLVQSHGVATKKFIELCGDAADGQVLPAGRLLVVDQLPRDDPQKELLAGYKKNFEERYGPVSTFGGHAYDALKITVKAIENAGSTDPAAIRDELEKIKGFVGTGGIFNMSASDHNGLTKDAFVMVEIKNRDWALIEGY